MLNSAMPEPLVFPNPDPPKPGETIEVRPGVLWARFPLPFRLDHVNIYLIEDGDGLGGRRCGNRRCAIARGVGGAARRAASRPQADAGHRHPLSPGPCGPRRVALRALRLAACDERGGISDRAQHSPRSTGTEIGALSQLLSLAWADGGKHGAPARQRTAVFENGLAASEDVSASHRRGADQDRRP